MNDTSIIFLGGIIGLITIGIGLKKYDPTKSNHSKNSNHSKKSNDSKKNKSVKTKIINTLDILSNIEKEVQTIKLENEYNILEDIFFNDQIKPQLEKTHGTNLKNRFDKNKTELKTLHKEIVEFKKNPTATEKEYEKISKKMNSLIISKQNTWID